MTQVWLPSCGRFTVKNLGPTGRRLLAVLGGHIVDVLDSKPTLVLGSERPGQQPAVRSTTMEQADNSLLARARRASTDAQKLALYYELVAALAGHEGASLSANPNPTERP